MDLRKASKKHLWKLFILAYLLLIVGSYLSIRFADANPPNSFHLESGKPVLLYFNDPVLDHGIINDEIRELFNVISWEYINSNPTHLHSNLARVAQYLDSLGVSNVHIVGEGIGGGMALQFVKGFPEKVTSVSLLGANGVVELELLGGYHLNNAVYGAKYVFFVLSKYGIPHFGLLKNLDRQIIRAKIQYDSDQRLARNQLSSIQVPTLIQHFNDSRIPPEVSKEHARLIPQSQLFIYDGQKLTARSHLVEFIKTSSQNSTSKVEATTLRLIQGLLPFDPSNNIKAEGRALIILMIVIILSTLVSEDLTCIGTGLMIARGLIGFFPGVFACLFGIFFGDILLYLAGRWLASSTLHKAPLKWFISEKDVEKSYHWFQAKGPAIIIASRFIPGTRFPTYFSAGAIGASFWMFILYFGVASLIWTPALVGLAVLVGQEMIGYFNLYQDYALWVLFGFLLAAYVLFKIIIPLFTFRGRRVLVGKWKRITNWEFWPPYIIYSFVMVYMIGLWFKYKSPTIFALANPSIPEGGFIKESKKEILNRILAKESVARYDFIPKENSFESRKEIIEKFQYKTGVNYPLVLKPDAGERGKGVFIVKNETQLDEILIEITSDYIVQEFIEGKEYGVFYYRYPSKEHGQIFSITKKVYLSLLGDGKHTLEELILKDSRAVCLAELHFNQHIDDLYEVPPKGKKINLVELGTHARGAIFYDSNDLVTKQLAQEIDGISKSFKGFYFGRYDIKVPSEDHLKKGEGIKVIEVNGVTSESTNIYDPKHSFLFGIKTLIRQWKIAYEIGYQIKVQNPELKEPTISHLLSLLR